MSKFVKGTVYRNNAISMIESYSIDESENQDSEIVFNIDDVLNWEDDGEGHSTVNLKNPPFDTEDFTLISLTSDLISAAQLPD